MQNLSGGDFCKKKHYGLFGPLNFQKLIFLDHQNFGEISQNLHFYCSLRYNFAKFSLKVKFFLNEFEFSLKFFNFFIFQNFLAPSAPTIGLLGRFLHKILVFLDLKVTPQCFSKSLPLLKP